MTNGNHCKQYRRNEVYAVNANAYFSKPGPRTVTGLEILTKIIYPESSGLMNYPLIHLPK